MQFSQVKSIITQQQAEWSKVMAEEAVRMEYIKYGAVLVLISQLGTFLLTAFLFSSSRLFYYPTEYFAAVGALQVALGILALYLVPQILAAIAPSFGGQNNVVNATKLYVFSMTPGWIGMFFVGIPILGWLLALAGGVYGIFLFWQHFSEAMTIPLEKKVGYAVVSILAIVVVMWVISAVAYGIAASVFIASVVHPFGQF